MAYTLKRILPLTLCLMLAIYLTPGLSPILNTTPVMAQYVDFDGNDLDIGGTDVPPAGDPVCANCNGAGCEQCQPSTGGDDTGGDTGGDTGNDTGNDNTGSDYTGGNDNTGSDDTGSDNTGSDDTGGNDTGGSYTGSDNTGGGYTGNDNTGDDDTDDDDTDNDGNDTNSGTSGGTNTSPQPNPQPNPQPTVDQEALKREQFEKDKNALLADFKSTIGSGVVSIEPPTSGDAVYLGDDGGFGFSVIPAGLTQPGGLTQDEWYRAGECQRELDALYGKWPLSAEEIERQEKFETERNALWKKAINIPGLTAEERERIRLRFHTQAPRPGTPPIPTVTSSTIQQWQKVPPLPYKEPPSTAPVPEPVNPLTNMLLKHFLVDQPTAGIEFGGELLAEKIIDSPFANIVGLGKIAVAYKEGGAASARAATADFLVGLISYPQAQFAVDGGRKYANVGFEAMNRFMTDALKATGGEFDREKFWSDLKKESSVGMQAQMEWLGYEIK